MTGTGVGGRGPDTRPNGHLPDSRVPVSPVEVGAIIDAHKELYQPGEGLLHLDPAPFIGIRVAETGLVSAFRNGKYPFLHQTDKGWE